MKAKLLLDQVAVQAPSIPAPPPKDGDIHQPKVQYYPTLDTWRLCEDYGSWCGDHYVHISAPFDYDLASIPKKLWSLLGSHELGLRAPLFHDLLYRSGGAPGPDVATITPARIWDRGQADSLFLEHMKEDGISWFRRRAAYYAVRIFGGGSWRDELV